MGGEERCGKKEKSHDILLYQGIGFPISILGNFNLINEYTLHSLHNKKKRKTRQQVGFPPSHCVSRLIKVCNGMDE